MSLTNRYNNNKKEDKTRSILSTRKIKKQAVFLLLVYLLQFCKEKKNKESFMTFPRQMKGYHSNSLSLFIF